jgi:hypothetical protein
MLSKRLVMGLFFVCLLVGPLVLSVPTFGQDYYQFVWKLDGNGTDYQFGYPRSLAVDSQGSLYVTDWGTYYVLKFDKNGQYVGRLGGQGDGPGQFYSCTLMVAVDKSDNVYVTCGTHQGPGRVNKYSSAGNLIWTWEIPVDEYGGAGGAVVDIDVDASGNIYLITLQSWAYPVIRKFNAERVYQGGMGFCGHPCHDEEVYNFVYPGYIAVNSQGDIFASVWGEFYCGLPYGHDALPECPPFDYHSQIKKFDSAYAFIARWYLDFVTAIAIDAEDNVFACSQRDWAMGLYKYDSKGNLLQLVAPNGPEEGKIWGPHSVTVDLDGNVYVGDQLNRIQKFAPSVVPYTFDGFFSPIENDPIVNKAKAGQAIPIKWRVTDKDGLPISDPSSFVGLTSYGVNCSSFEGDPTNSVEESAAGQSGLQYLGDGWWQFNWKTPKSYSGQCRIMKLTLDDKSEHTASFRFK